MPEVGEEITIEYVPTAPWRKGRTSITGKVKEVSGQNVYVTTCLDDITLILDGDGDLWARDEDHNDGLFGTIATVVD